MERRYIPHQFQRKFHKSKARIRIVDTGRQTGKTLSGIIELIWHLERGLSSCHRVINRIEGGKTVCSECGNECKLVPVNALVVAPTYRMLDDINIKMFRDWVPQWFSTGWNEQKKRLTIPNGGVCEFRSAEEPDRLRGVTLDILWMDEASFMKRAAWEVVQPATLVRDALILITTTPRGQDWVYKEFYQKAGSTWTVQDPLLEIRQEAVNIINPVGNKDIEAFHYRTFDVEHISLEQILKKRDEMSEKMFRQEYMATFEQYTGLVYDMFDERMHVIEDTPAETRLQYFVGIDVGYRNPTAMLLIGEDANHNLYVIDEVYESGLLAPAIAEKFKKLIAGKEIRDVIIDPASRQSTQASQGMSILDQIIELGVPARIGNNDVIAGINRVSQMLTPDTITGRPKVFICRRCINLREEIAGYVWDDSKEDKNAPERPKKVKDHLCDAMRYVLMERPDWYKHMDSKDYAQSVVQGEAVSLLEDRIDPDIF